MWFRYKKWDEESLFDSIDMRDTLSDFVEKIFSKSDIKGAIEDMMRYGFQVGDKNVMGTNELLREIRKKKIEELRKNIRGTYEELKNDIRRVQKEEMEELGRLMREIMEKYEQNEILDQAQQERDMRENRLNNLPSSVSQSINKVSQYDRDMNFLSLPASEVFKRLLENYEKIARLEEFLRKHPYGFVEGEPLSLDDAQDVMDRFEKIESLEDSLRRGDIDNFNFQQIKDLLTYREYESLRMMHKLVEYLRDSGYITVRGNVIYLTLKGIKKIGQKVLRDIYGDLRSSLTGRHETRKYGNIEIDFEEKKEWEFGSNTVIDVISTIKNAIIDGRYDKKTRKVKLDYSDFVVYKTKHASRSATALLLDMSWSMSWGGKFEAAKKVALALYHLISSYFANDSLYIVGFFTIATELKPIDLPTVDLNLGDPFTNIQDAVRLSRKLLSRDLNSDKRVIIVTDGQPTAYFLDNRLFVEWPVMGVSPNAMRETMKEVELATKDNIKINIFMIEENPNVAKFVEEVVRINRGKAFFTTPENLGKYVLMDFLESKRKVIH